jgi:hypothetical protein
MGRPNRLGNYLSVHVSVPETLYDLIQDEMKKRQQQRPGSSISMSEVIRSLLMEGLGMNGEMQ